MTEQELREQYLVKLNIVVELSLKILSGNWTSYAAIVNKACDELTRLGEITSPASASVVEQIGWYVSERGNRDALEVVGNALIHLAEHYRAGAPIVAWDLVVADWRIDGLERLLLRKQTLRE